MGSPLSWMGPPPVGWESLRAGVRTLPGRGHPPGLARRAARGTTSPSTLLPCPQGCPGPSPPPPDPGLLGPWSGSKEKENSAKNLLDSGLKAGSAAPTNPCALPASRPGSPAPVLSPSPWGSGSPSPPELKPSRSSLAPAVEAAVSRFPQPPFRRGLCMPGSSYSWCLQAGCPFQR